MQLVEIFLPMSVFVTLAVIVGLICRLISTGMLHRTIREAIKTDPGSVPILAERLEARQPWADALLGWIMLAAGAALLLLAMFETDPGARTGVFQAAVIPAVIGVTILLYTRWGRPKPA